MLSPTGSSKQVIAKEGTSERTDWRMVSFPAVERKREFQLTSFWWILSTMEALKRSLFFLPKCSEKEMYDFTVLIICPDAVS